MSQYRPDRQLDLGLYRRDGRWRMRVAVGAPGRAHASAVAAQDYEIDDALAASLLGCSALGARDEEVAAQITEFWQHDGGVADGAPARTHGWTALEQLEARGIIHALLGESDTIAADEAVPYAARWLEEHPLAKAVYLRGMRQANEGLADLIGQGAELDRRREELLGDLGDDE